VRAVVRRRCRTDALAEDAVQEALLTVHRVRHTYMPGRPVKPWLAAIADRRAIDVLRRDGRIGRRELNDDIAYETFADPAANKEEATDSAQTLGQLTGALSPGQKEAIELVKIREMSLAEASAVSGQSVASLKVNIHRAIKKMRAVLAREGERE
jgi:RNA polymerase sigma-70 factor, ECF subfamily